MLGTARAPAPAAAYPPPATYPEPVEHCDVCRWAELCASAGGDDDHLSLVAGITARQRKALVRSRARHRGAPRRGADPVRPASRRDERRTASSASASRLGSRSRARAAKPIHELLLPTPGEPIEPERGLATAAPARTRATSSSTSRATRTRSTTGSTTSSACWTSTGAFTAYLVVRPRRAVRGHAWPARSARSSGSSTSSIERHARNPQMHVYHYAPYEPTALKRLMGRHATREEEVDRLLRGGVLVDLFRAVRQGLRASVESYSIKRIEPLYDFRRASRPPRCRLQHRRVRGVAPARRRGPARAPTSSTRSRPTTAMTS